MSGTNKIFAHLIFDCRYAATVFTALGFVFIIRFPIANRKHAFASCLLVKKGEGREQNRFEVSLPQLSEPSTDQPIKFDD